MDASYITLKPKVEGGKRKANKNVRNRKKGKTKTLDLKYYMY